MAERKRSQATRAISQSRVISHGERLTASSENGGRRADLSRVGSDYRTA